MGMYRSKCQRIIKKYLDMDLPWYGVNPGETRRSVILNICKMYGPRKKINKYINRYIKDPDKVLEDGGVCIELPQTWFAPYKSNRIR
jgi:hypothetical protein